MMPDLVRLQHILDAADRITRYASDQRDEKTLDAVIRQLAVIGEAVRHVSPGLRKFYPDIPWKSIVGLRNLVIHEYFIISMERIWEIVDRDIPVLMPQIRNVIKRLSTH